MKISKDILKILDASINRITEGLRVIEEVLRFLYKDSENYKILRKLRHEVAKLFFGLYRAMLKQRDSTLDPGRMVGERKYSYIYEILISNFHRVTESLRVLEEISKLIDIKRVLKVKKIRYQVYDLEKRIIEKLCEK
ncbi:MAG: thiamine-phosphate pyrophosphorylase [Endomicrobia bacterium]|nr:thiamine-phosphate pyrophosphorylase [Endomicrobiia bacterium]